MFVALTHALPLKTTGTDYATLMGRISQQQAGFRRAEQVDLKGLFRHLSKLYKDARPAEQSIMDNDLFIFTGKNQAKLRRDAIVSNNFANYCIFDILLEKLQ